MGKVGVVIGTATVTSLTCLSSTSYASSVSWSAIGIPKSWTPVSEWRSPVDPLLMSQSTKGVFAISFPSGIAEYARDKWNTLPSIPKGNSITSIAFSPSGTLTVSCSTLQSGYDKHNSLWEYSHSNWRKLNLPKEISKSYIWILGWRNEHNLTIGCSQPINSDGHPISGTQGVWDKTPHGWRRVGGSLSKIAHMNIVAGSWSSKGELGVVTSTATRNDVWLWASGKWSRIDRNKSINDIGWSPSNVLTITGQGTSLPTIPASNFGGVDQYVGGRWLEIKKSTGTAAEYPFQDLRWLNNGSLIGVQGGQIYLFAHGKWSSLPTSELGSSGVEDMDVVGNHIIALSGTKDKFYIHDVP